MAYRKFTKSERYILQALADKPGSTSLEVHAACDIHRTYALRKLKAMTLQGLVEAKMEMPTYTLTEHGKSVLDSLNNA